MAHWATSYYLPVLRDDRTFRGRYYDLFRDFYRPSFPNRLSELQDWNYQWDRLHSDVWDLAPASDATGPARPVQELQVADPSHCIIHEPDGKPKFQVQFNAKNFRPEDILVSTEGNQLLVSIKRQQSTGSVTEYKELTRCMDLPSNVFSETLTASLSSDGILSIEGQVQMPGQEASSELAPEGQPQLRNAVIAKDIVGPAAAVAAIGPRPSFAFQLPLCGFYPEEIKVETLDRTLYISGTHEEKRGGLQAKYSFSKRYVLPPNVDKEQLKVYLRGERLVVVEAPTMESGQPQPIIHMLPVEHR